MKKIILATTALVSVAGSALAQESMVMGPMGAEAHLGGYYEYRYTDYSDGLSSSSADAEIFLSFSTISDSGLEIGVDYQLEANTGSTTNVDEASLYVAGEFGRVVFGENDHASDSFQTWAPTHAGSIGQDDGQNADFYNDGQELGGWAGNAQYSDDAKIAYFSPSFSGFAFGISWQEAMADDDDAAVTGGLSYSVNVADGMDVTLNAASFNNGKDGSDEDSSTSYGADLGLGDFAVTLATVDYNAAASRTGLGLGYTISDDLSVGAYFAEQGDKEWNSFSAQYVIASGLTATLARNGVENNGTDSDELVFEIGISF
jgi:outer membrane protein OmpU